MVKLQDIITGVPSTAVPTKPTTAPPPVANAFGIAVDWIALGYAIFFILAVVVLGYRKASTFAIVSAGSAGLLALVGWIMAKFYLNPAAGWLFLVIVSGICTLYFLLRYFYDQIKTPKKEALLVNLKNPTIFDNRKFWPFGFITSISFFFFLIFVLGYYFGTL